MITFKQVSTVDGKRIDCLFGDAAASVIDDINNTLVEVEWALDDPAGLDRHFQYDQIVSIGEMLSTKIISAYLNLQGLKNVWVDARDLIRTDNTYQDARIDWEVTGKMTSEKVNAVMANSNMIVTQGFIGGTSENFTTTLGREGSDFTAAILAYCTKAKDVTIWKDVPGVLNADPKYYDNTVLIPQMSYFDAMELAYFGMSVIHPKTIKPLQNANIPLFVRSFLQPTILGTSIANEETDKSVPSFVAKRDQALISISPKDHSFVSENHFIRIFTLLDQLRIKTNVMQNAAISFSFCMNFNVEQIELLIQGLQKDFDIHYNDSCELITVRYFDDPTIRKLVSNRKVLLEQRTRKTTQLVVR